eukprot:6463187-Amphidinium_carterae.1
MANSCGSTLRMYSEAETMSNLKMSEVLQNNMTQTLTQLAFGTGGYDGVKGNTKLDGVLGERVAEVHK